MTPTTASITFDELCRQALACAGDVSPEVRERIVRDLRLRFEYPDEYVAYVDRCEMVNKVRRWRREIVAHSARLEDVQEALAQCDQRKREQIVLDFIENLDDDGLEQPHNIPER